MQLVVRQCGEGGVEAVRAHVSARIAHLQDWVKSA